MVPSSGTRNEGAAFRTRIPAKVEQMI